MSDLAVDATGREVAIARQVETGKTDLLFRNAGLAQAVSVANALVMLLVQGEPGTHLWTIVWFVAVASVAMLRYRLAQRYQATKETRTSDAWRRLAVNGAMVAAVLWSIGVAAFFVADRAGGRMLYALIMAGIVAGAVPILSSVLAAYRGYAMMILLSVICVALVDYRSSSDAVLALVALLFLFTMLRSARYFHDTLDQALRAEYSMQGLVARLEQARDTAEMASFAKSRFLGNMGHELRTPLNGVIGMADILAMTTLDAEQQEYVRSLQTEAQRLHRMIEDVLELAKLDASKVALQEAPFMLDEALRIGLRAQATAAAARGLDWQFACAPGMALLRYGDSACLLQAVTKLVDNAIKFTEHGSIKLGVGEAADGMVKIEVADSGIGMTPAQCAAVLTDFTQVDASATRRHGGLGIGLTLARRIAALMRGRLEVESVPGQGSTFRLLVPLPVAPA